MTRIVLVVHKFTQVIDRMLMQNSHRTRSMHRLYDTLATCRRAQSLTVAPVGVLQIKVTLQ